MTVSDSSLPPVSREDAAQLLAAVVGEVLLPGDDGYDEERAVFNVKAGARGDRGAGERG
ncbi:hypothetical protein [Asanoa ishikariensis]|uniref:hypothetical protein n=1 Tax=Asanoa ishikariensis TaxID=137265 RepID=UPI00194EBCA8|nr:hypothetical protein [Asanoa ishikariensis]